MNQLTCRLREMTFHNVAEEEDVKLAANELDRLWVIEKEAKELTENYSASGFASFVDLVHGRR